MLVPRKRLNLLSVALLALAATTACRSKSSTQRQEPTAQGAKTTSEAIPEGPSSPPTAPEPHDQGPSPDEISHLVTKGDIELLTGAQLKQRIANSKARATLVNAWASWCGPCRREFPMLVALREKLAKQKVDLLFISMDDADGHQAALDFGRERGEISPLLVARRPLGEFKAAMSPKWPGMLPATFLFDESGKLRYFWPGEVFEREIPPIVDGLLAGEDIDGFARVGLQKGSDTRY